MQRLDTLKLALIIGLLSAAGLQMTACTGAPRHRGSFGQLECGPELSEETILRIAREAIQAIGGDPAKLARGHDIEILEDGCDYVLSAVPVGTGAIEGISMRISREGLVESFPWCCPLGSCPDLCVPPPPSTSSLCSVGSSTTRIHIPCSTRCSRRSGTSWSRRRHPPADPASRRSSY